MFSKISNYFRSSFQELKKVSWPTKKDILRYLLTILASLVLATGFIMLIDFGLSRLVRLIFSI